MTITLELDADLDWVCTTCCEYPIYATSLTDVEGTETIVGLNDDLITGVGDRTITSVTVCDTPAIDCRIARLFRTTTGSTVVRYNLQCIDGEWSLTAKWWYSAHETTCTEDEFGNITLSDPDWAYSTGSCSAFYTVQHGEAEVECTVSSAECSADSFYLEASVPNFTDPVFGLTIPSPGGGTVVISS